MWDRLAGPCRLVLLSVALLMLIGSFLVPLAPRDGWRSLHDSGQTLRNVATAVAALWGVIDAGLAITRRRRSDDAATYLEIALRILANLEDSGARLCQATSTTKCSLVIWRAHRLGWRERRRGETRRPLRSQYVYRGQGHVASGVQWRVGMGVIGQAIERNDALITEVEALWAPLRRGGERAWEDATDEARQGLTYGEFLLADHSGPGSTTPGAPTVFAVPVVRGSATVGCVALDVPNSMTEVLEDVTEAVLRDLTTLGRIALSGA